MLYPSMTKGSACRPAQDQDLRVAAFASPISGYEERTRPMRGTPLRFLDCVCPYDAGFRDVESESFNSQVIAFLAVV